MLLHRALTAAVGIPVGLALIYAGGWYLAASVMLLAAATLREHYRLAFVRYADPPLGMLGAGSWLRSLGYLLALLLPAAAIGYDARWPGGLAVALAAALAMVAWASSAVRRRPSSDAAALWVAAVGTGLLPGLLVYLVYLRGLAGEPLAMAGLPAAVPAGAGWLALVVAACWAADTAAYAVGKTLGAHKLWPSVSPGKTVEGSIGGLLGSVLLTLALGRWLGLPTVHSLALGSMLGVAGQLGDLAESKLKRWAGVKDSGSMLPGHGGALDRFDSLLVSAPLAYCYLRLAVGA